MEEIYNDDELFDLIKKAVIEKDINAKFEIIIIFQNLINKEAKINGQFSQECKDYIEDKIIKKIDKFKKIKK